MSRKFYYSERERQLELIEKKFFAPDIGNGCFRGKTYPFILNNGLNNLYKPIREASIQYFADNGISWWGGKKPTGHVLSSQIACLNHLMILRKDPEAVLALINGVRNQFKRVLPLSCDNDTSYIAFEAVSKHDHLGEDGPTRGSNCTSVDALVLAVDNDDKRWLIPIEWKYTESYNDGAKNDKSFGSKGVVRMSRYNNLINSSDQLKSLTNYKGSIYYFEPFYQLMRQTLWAEQMIKNKETELIKADFFLHIHVVPHADSDLLDKKYRLSEKNMEETWTNMLYDKSKYIIVDPKEFLSPIQAYYPELWEYLSRRYFN